MDERWMRRALALSRRGRPHPNPHVGAVVVRGGRIVGEGFHRRQGLPHAEVVALRQAGRRARGGTLFVTLEPCDHWGLTPPCSEAILAAGIQRVVIAARDPDPRARGRGPRRLRRAGVDIQTGLLEAESLEVNEAYVHAHHTGRPLVELKLAASLDGRVALASGESRWITGEAARRQVHRLRARADAVLVGSGTVRRDDPSLTVRGVRGRQPVRVIVSRGLDLPPRARLFRDGKAPTWVLTGERAAEGSRGRRLRQRGVEVIAVRGPRPSRRTGRAAGKGAARDDSIALEAALRELAARGIRRILVEGGVEVATGLLRQGLVDRLVLHLAPIIVGGEHLSWPGPLGVRHLAQSLGLDEVRVRRLGTDIEIEGRLRSRRTKRRSPAKRG